MALLNELDAKILKHLLADGRTSFVEMAKTLQVTKNKIWKRYRILEKKGIITGSTVQINFTSFGYDALATLLISVEAQQIDKVMNYIGKITEIRAYR
ncbi:MAG: Lrp/AsnC family transcriptional regulator, partial [Candidatus Bathyarchaeota archaeon]|nr:Lrp/AsnC family transcriptional regulator [Candidatus Bathyarchaeota archaeon]